ncbi:MAG: hypothetical protein EBR86_10505 [Planctomycetia bacterium]|nr:hypothetical protein [Planctomycetia bacterium]
MSGWPRRFWISPRRSTARPSCATTLLFSSRSVTQAFSSGTSMRFCQVSMLAGRPKPVRVSL